MGYLLFMDALGIQSYYNQGIKKADPVMNRISASAKSVFGASLPNQNKSLKKFPGNKLVIMNDSVFMHSMNIEHILYFASKFSKTMFIPEKQVDPIAFRGAVSITESIPKIIVKNEDNVSIAKFVIDNISAAMIAEKKSILGARIIIPKEIITDDIMRKLDIKYQVLLMDLSSFKSISGDVFGTERDGYFDIAWMIGYDKVQEKRIENNIISYWQNAVYNQRSAAHASATMALYSASKIKSKSIRTVINVLYNGQRKAGLFTDPIPKSSSFEEILNYGQSIQKNREVFIAP